MDKQKIMMNAGVSIHYSDGLIHKAERLVREKKVYKITDDHFIVDGRTGRHDVLKSGDHFKCECKGFLLRNPPICSHVIAVMMTLSKAKQNVGQSDSAWKGANPKL